jgi:hypothetical protein
MAHELAGALQQVSRIQQRCAVKEPQVYVRMEDIDVASEPKYSSTELNCGRLRERGWCIVLRCPRFTIPQRELVRKSRSFITFYF